MVRTQGLVDDDEIFTQDELRAMRRKLESLALLTVSYPLACSVGGYDLLFESRDDIALVIDNLNDEISETRKAA